MLAIYIGSFNPITKAHLTIAQATLQYATKCIFVPVSDLYAKDSLQVSAEHRLNMIKCAIQNEPRFGTSNLEIEIAQKFHKQNKTLETLRQLKEIYQEDLAFVIGADNLVDIKNWYHYQELLKEFRLIVVTRNRLDIETYIQTDRELKELLKNAIILNDLHLAISSKMVRERIKEHLPIDQFVEQEVQDYIVEHRLYGGS